MRRASQRNRAQALEVTRPSSRAMLSSVAVHASQHKGRDWDRAGPLVVRENQSRRDLTNVAQYPAAAELG
jgi:hypothetical protein